MTQRWPGLQGREGRAIVRGWLLALGLSAAVVVGAACTVGFGDGEPAAPAGSQEAVTSPEDCDGFVIQQTGAFAGGVAPGAATPPFAGTVVILDGTAVFDAPGDVPHLVVGSDLDDTIFGSLRDDIICGNDGDDDFSGDAGNDRIFGGAGCDHLDGDPGDDHLFGGPGDDGSAGCVRGGLEGGAGDDILNGGAGIDTCRNDDGVDVLMECEDVPAPRS